MLNASQILSEVASRVATSSNGRSAAICRAHAREPQHGSISSAALASGKRFHCARMLFTLTMKSWLPATIARIRAIGCPEPRNDTAPRSEYRRLAELPAPGFAWRSEHCLRLGLD